MQEDYKTTISVLASTRDKIKSCGCKGESYDEIILRLIGKDMEEKNNGQNIHTNKYCI